MSDVIAQIFNLENCIVDTYDIAYTDDGKEYSLVKAHYSGELPKKCPHCSGTYYKHGARKVAVLDTPLGGKPTKIEISFPRLRCTGCGSMHSPELASIDERRRVTNRAKLDITEKCLRNTFEDVTNEYLTTGPSVKNIFEDFLEENKDKLRFKTPVFLGIDEIKIRGLSEITVITDLEHHTLYDILPKRDAKALKEYFSQLPDRESVLWVCSDMYRPFENPISGALPNAQWAIDHFHLVAYANRAVDDIRKTIQGSLRKNERLKTKKGLAYTLKTRYDRLDADDAENIRNLRIRPKYAPLATAYDLKEAFFNIYDENPTSVDNAKQAFEDWAKSIPSDPLFDKFRELVKTTRHFYAQIFNYWNCPIAISNGFTECTNRLIRENNCRGRGYSFEILRGRTLYRKTNIKNALKGGTLIGPAVTETEVPFHFNSRSEDFDDFADDIVEFEGELVNSETGEVMQITENKESNQ